MKLFPRLPNRFAEDLFTRQSALPSGEIHGSVSHAYMIWPATGASRVGDQDLARIARRVVFRRRARRIPGAACPL